MDFYKGRQRSGASGFRAVGTSCAKVLWWKRAWQVCGTARRPGWLQHCELVGGEEERVPRQDGRWVTKALQPLSLCPKRNERPLVGLSRGDSACFESLGKRPEAGQSYGKAGRHLQAVTVAQAGSDVACAADPGSGGELGNCAS